MKFLLYLYILSLPFEYLWYELFGSLTVWKPYRIIGIVLILYWLVSAVAKRTKVVIDVYDKLFIFIFSTGLALALFWMILGYGNLVWAINDLLLISFSFLIYLTVKNMHLSQKEIAQILYIFVFTCTINSIFMIYNFASSSYVYQARGFYRSAAQAGYVDGISLLILISICLFNLRKLLSLPGVFCTISILILSYALFLSGARGSIVGFSAGLTAITFLIFRIRYAWDIPIKRFVSIFALILILIMLCVANMGFLIEKEKSPTITRFEIENLKVAGGRPDIWRSAWNLTLDRYFIGVGLAQYRYYHTSYIKKLPNVLSDTVLEYDLVTHSDYVSLLVEFGIICLVIYLFILVSLFRKLFVAAERFGKQSFIYPAMLGIFVLLITCGVFRVSWLTPDYWLFLGLTTTAIKIHGIQTYTSRGNLSKFANDPEKPELQRKDKNA